MSPVQPAHNKDSTKHENETKLNNPERKYSGVSTLILKPVTAKFHRLLPKSSPQTFYNYLISFQLLLSLLNQYLVLHLMLASVQEMTFPCFQIPKFCGGVGPQSPLGGGALHSLKSYSHLLYFNRVYSLLHNFKRENVQMSASGCADTNHLGADSLQFHF